MVSQGGACVLMLLGVNGARLDTGGNPAYFDPNLGMDLRVTFTPRAFSHAGPTHPSRINRYPLAQPTSRNQVTIEQFKKARSSPEFFW